MSLVGALLLFFSWVSSNAIYAEIAATKSSIQQGRNDHRLFAELNDIDQKLHQNAISLVSIQMDQIPWGETQQFDQPDPIEALMARDYFNLQRTLLKLDIDRVRFLQSSCQNLVPVTDIVEENSRILENLHKNCDKAHRLSVKAEQEFEELASLSKIPKTRAEIDAIGPAFESMSIKIAIELENLVDRHIELANLRLEEIERVETDISKAASGWKTITHLFYVIGTLLVIGGRLMIRLKNE